MKQSYKQYLYDLLSYLFELDLNNSFSFMGLDNTDDECILINHPIPHLYCLELISSSNETNYITDTVIKSLCDSFSTGGQIYFCIYKEEQKIRFVIFAREKRILKYIQQNTKSIFLKYDEILNFIFDLFLINKTTIEDNKILNRYGFSFDIDLNNPYTSWNNIVKECAYNTYKNAKVYQCEKLNVVNDTDINNVLRHKYKGALWVNIDFTKRNIKNQIDENRNTPDKSMKDRFTKLKEAFDNNSFPLVIANSLLILQNEDNNQEVIGSIQDIYGLQFVPKHIGVKKIIKKTPLLHLDSDYDMLIKPSDLAKILAFNAKSIVPNYDVLGLTPNNSFFTFSFTQIDALTKTVNKFATMVGTVGSGKTTTSNAFLARLIKLKLKYKCDFSENQIRYFDIKGSGLNLIKQVLETKNKDDVQKIILDMNLFAYNPIAIEYNESTKVIDENQLEFAILIISTIIETKDKNSSLDISELNILKENIKNIYLNQDYEVKTINKLPKSIQDSLLLMGYLRNDKINIIKEKEYEYLNKPNLKDLLSFLQKEEHKQNDQTRKDYQSLSKKLAFVANEKVYNSISVDDIKNPKPLVYMDFDEVKDNDSNYVPMFLSMFLSLYKVDRKRQEQLMSRGEERPTIHYIFEEANNVLNKTAFQDILIKFINEARSYNIRVTFVTQSMEHIPTKIQKQIEHKFFLLPNGSLRENFIHSEILPYLQNTQDNKKIQIIKQILNLPSFYIVLINSGGVSYFKIPLNDEEIKLYGQAT